MKSCKQCSKCCQFKDYSQFPLRKHGKGHQKWCFACRSEEDLRAGRKLDDKTKTQQHIARMEGKVSGICILRKCWKCLKVNLPEHNFDKRPDGSLKSWCIRCCSKRSKTLTNMYARRVEKYGTTKSQKKKSRSKIRSNDRFSHLSSYPGDNYMSRNMNLKLMNFKDYRAYLKSALWKSIRIKVFTAKGRTCSLCPAKATALHHNRYHIDDLAGRTLEHVHPICDDCHDFIEHGVGNVKRHLHEARAAFNRMYQDHLAGATI